MEHLELYRRYSSSSPWPYSMMYTFRPWTIRQYAGFSTAERSNAFYRCNLASRSERSVCCIRPSDPPWLRPRSSRVVGDVGKAGVSICSPKIWKFCSMASPWTRCPFHDHERSRTSYHGILYQCRTGTRPNLKKWQEPSRMIFWKSSWCVTPIFIRLHSLWRLSRHLWIHLSKDA